MLSLWGRQTNDSGPPFRRSARVNPNPNPDPRNGGPPEWGAGTRTNWGWKWKCYRTLHTDQTWPRSDYRLFGSMKKILGGQKFASDTELQSTVCQWLRQQPASFFTSGIQKLVNRWDKFFNEFGYVEK